MKPFTIIVELCSFIFFLSALFSMLHGKDWRAAARLMSAAIFGISLEFITVYSFDDYSYSTDFLVQISEAPHNVPIAIGLSWGLIIYCCMRFSDRVGMSEWMRPLLDGLLALTVDLSLDAIAIRLDGGFWHWKKIPLESIPTLNGFFGVDYSNFYGWFFIVMIFSYLLRFESNVLVKRFQIRPAVSALYFCIIPLIAYLPLFIFLEVAPIPAALLFCRKLNFIGYDGFIYIVTTIAVIGAALSLVITNIIRSPHQTSGAPGWMPRIIFFYFHVWPVSFYLAGGFFHEAPLLLLVCITMLLIDAFFYVFLLRRGADGTRYNH